MVGRILSPGVRQLALAQVAASQTTLSIGEAQQASEQIDAMSVDSATASQPAPQTIKKELGNLGWRNEIDWASNCTQKWPM